MSVYLLASKWFQFDKKNNSITFKFFGITNIHYLPKGYVFCAELYLILSDDQTNANLTKVECYLPEEVNSSNEKKQADLDCKIIDLDEDKEYKSFEIHNSEQIAGIPEDKTLLDPDKTAETISNGQQLLDYSDEENKYTYPAYFSASEDAEFTLHLTYQPYHKLQYIIPKSKPHNIYITCQIDHPIYSFIFIEQQVIRKGWKYSLLPLLLVATLFGLVKDYP